MSPHNAALIEELMGRQRHLLVSLLEAEEQLKRCLMQGEHAGVAEINEKRVRLAEELASLEKRRADIIPADTTMHTYIADNLAHLLPLVEEIKALLLRLNTVKEINTVLLRERLRFVQEVKSILLAGDETYSPDGALNPALENITRINENC